ncbi:hypothetical protein PILCRDRAFT_56716, partial [Piloderma croceum F 1598]
MTQIVNALTAKIEIGGPMASLYLLRNPDHYTGHTFKTFYWKSYVSISAVDDYVYHPAKYEHINLYDWIRLSDKQKKTKRKKQETFESSEKDIDCDKYEQRENDAYLRGSSWADSSDSEGSDDDDDDDSGCVPFEAGHHQHTSHTVQIQADDGTIVPNFVGGSLPRCDKGDREFYCCTMLTLFKPWKSGKDLKTRTESWDDSFLAYNFNQRQQEILRYFNSRYECLDARDDYSANRDKQKGDVIFSQWSMDALLDDLDNENLIEGEDFGIDEHQVNGEYDRIGKEGEKVIEQMMEMDHIVKNSGWLNECVDGLPLVDL